MGRWCRFLSPISAALSSPTWSTGVMWERFSVCLITAGLLMADLAAIAAVVDLANPQAEAVLFRALGYPLAVWLALLNVLLHHRRDGYTAVGPDALRARRHPFGISIIQAVQA